MVATTASKKPAACRRPCTQLVDLLPCGSCRFRAIGSRPGPLCQNELGKGSLDVMISARSSSAISGPMRASARSVSVAIPFVTVASLCVSASTSGQVLADSYGDNRLTDPGAAECRSAGNSTPSWPSHALLPRRQRSQAHRQFAARLPIHVIPHVGRGLRDVPSRVGLCPFAPRTSPVFGQQPARRHRRCRSCQETWTRSVLGPWPRATSAPLFSSGNP